MYPVIAKHFLEPAASKSKAFEDNLFRLTGVYPWTLYPVYLLVMLV
jgi:hypothetical protein